MNNVIENYCVDGLCTADNILKRSKCRHSQFFGMSECVFNKEDVCFSVNALEEEKEKNKSEE